MPSRSPSKAPPAPDVKTPSGLPSPNVRESSANSGREEQLRALREQVAHAEQHGQFDTAHHEMLRRLEEDLKKGRDDAK